jgi:hypothetical protein
LTTANQGFAIQGDCFSPHTQATHGVDAIRPTKRKRAFFPGVQYFSVRCHGDNSRPKTSAPWIVIHKCPRFVPQNEHPQRYLDSLNQTQKLDGEIYEEIGCHHAHLVFLRFVAADNL